MDSVACDDSFVEGEPRFRAIPENKFINRVSITALRFRGPQTGEHCCFGLFEIGKPKFSLQANNFSPPGFSWLAASERLP